MKRACSMLLVGASLVLIYPLPVFAKKGKVKLTTAQANAVVTAVSYVNKGKTKLIDCRLKGLKAQAGKLKITGKGPIYSLKPIIKIKNKRKKAKLAGNKKKAKSLSKLLKVIKKACNDALTVGTASSMDPYTGQITTNLMKTFLERAAFGAGHLDYYIVQLGTSQGLNAAINELMKYKPLPPGVSTQAIDLLNEQEGVSLEEADMTLRGIRKFWYKLMASGSNPYHEKFAMFLLSLWTAADNVVSSSQRSLVYDYIQLMRSYSRDPDMRNLAKEASVSPLMLLYLNGDSNVNFAPNENFAREIMELFMLGVFDPVTDAANYTETGDIVRVARACTGDTVIEVPGPGGEEYWTRVYVPSNHFSGPHTIFAGTPWACSAEATVNVVDCMLSHPSAARYLASEILKYYLTPNPSKPLIQSFANVIQQHNFHLEEPMKILFRSKAFHDPAHRDKRLKDTVDFTMQFVRTLSIPYYDNGGDGLHDVMSNEGSQAITSAPSVFWWDHDLWASPPLVLGKANIMARLMRQTSLQSQEGWEWASVCPTAEFVTPQELVNFVASRMNVALNSTLRDQLVFYVSHSWNGSEYDNFAYDNREESDQRRKCGGLYYILGMSPGFGLS